MVDGNPRESRSGTVAPLAIDPGALTADRAVIAQWDERSVMVLLTTAGPRAYVNRCPHIGTPLDLVEGRVWTHDRQHLICATHGALFEPATGLCIKGPCLGQSLEPVPLQLADRAGASRTSTSATISSSAPEPATQPSRSS